MMDRLEILAIDSSSSISWSPPPTRWVLLISVVIVAVIGTPHDSRIASPAREAESCRSGPLKLIDLVRLAALAIVGDIAFVFFWRRETRRI